MNNGQLLKYLAAPLIFLTVTLLGGLRFGVPDNHLLFLRPELICLVLAVMVGVLFFQSGILPTSSILNGKLPALASATTVLGIFLFFAATVQLFNSLLPEKGLAFWVIALLFLWTLSSYMFAGLSATRLLQSLGGVVGLAFVVKYLLIANLTVPEETLTQQVFKSLLKEASFGFLDLPKFGPATGYVQFLTIILYFSGCLLMASDGSRDQNVSETVSDNN